MNSLSTNPRSTLHALQPIGVGSPEVESLLSYFCRLAVSHSVSSAALSRHVLQLMAWERSEKYQWNKGNLCGTGDMAERWAGALASLTGVGHLDCLTLLPWRAVVAQTALVARCGRWCPVCLAEDIAAERTPYFRLAWEVGEVGVCARHAVALVHACPDCGRTDARHGSAFVVPGWCAHCGAFLGRGGGVESASPEQVWKARQVGLMLTAAAALKKEPAAEELRDGILELVTRLDHGHCAAFARRVGLAKTTVHHWLKSGGVPTLDAHLRIVSQAGLTLPKLLTGDLSEWQMPTSATTYQLTFLFPNEKPSVIRRTLDWQAIRSQLVAWSKLPMPVSVAEAARRLELDPRQLYCQANNEARLLGERWRQHMERQGRRSLESAREVIAAACVDILAEGAAINLREVKRRVPAEILGSVRGVIDLLTEIKREFGVQ